MHRRLRFLRVAASAGTVAVAAACSGSETAPNPGAATQITVVGGNGQVALIGTRLSIPLTVKVTSNGVAISGAAVTFATISGAASVSPASSTTDGSGQAKTTLTLGSTAGNITITASVAGTSLTASFIETAATSSLTQACQSGSPLTPAAGAVVPGVNGTGVCLSGGSTGAEYALVAFHGNADPSALAALTVQSHGGVTGISSPSVVPAFDQAAAAAYVRYHISAAQQQFETNLRASARRDLTPLMA
jgi:hypothetical protein